jgi:drug/metabolite transporter (DMT)-like permease
MEDQTKGILYMVVSGTAFGTLGILGKLASQAGLSIPTVLAYRFVIGSLILWTALALRGDVRLLRGRALAVAVLLGPGVTRLRADCTSSGWST